MIEKIAVCKNNSEKLSTTNVSEHIPSDFSMSTILSFKDIESNHGVYKVKDCMEKFCESLKEHAKKIINFKKKKNKLINKRTAGIFVKKVLR